MLILCIKIFFFRIIDVSLGTFRTISTIKEKNILAGFIGFFEVFIWFTIVEEALSGTTNIWIALFYSLGFACGTIIGGYASKYLISSNITLQIVTTKKNMANYLRNEGFGVTIIKANGKTGIKNMLLLETTSKNYKKLLSLIRIIDENAFIIVNETKYIHNGFINQK